jgi:hypothetical protein
MSKEELTTKMHSEFTISKETEIKHLCFTALNDILNYGYAIQEVSKIYGVSVDQIKQHKPEFDKLNS